MKPQTLNGFDVFIKEPYVGKKEVKRSWKERLFALPFKPFKKTKLVTETIEHLKDDQVLTSEKTMIMNQATFNKLKAKLK